MTGLRLLGAVTSAAAAAAALAPVLVARAPRHLRRPNHAGRPVPLVLGFALCVGAVGGSALFAWGAGVAGAVAVAVNTGAVVAVLAAAGAVDDVLGRPTRGFAGHLGSLARGRPTTGILKLVVGVAAAVVTAIHLGGSPARMVAAALLLALCTNLWNALDVAPGRALKWAALVLIPVLAVAWERPSGFLLAGTLGAVLAVLPFDVGERGMLGDAGSNPLGFLVGLGLAVVLPTPALLAAAALALVLQVAAETVTISRLVEATPPLRWFDGLGRRT